MSSRQRLLVWLVFGFCFCPVVTWAGEPVTTPPSQRLLPVWRVLLLAYRHVEVDYTDDGGKQHHFSYKLPTKKSKRPFGPSASIRPWPTSIPRGRW